MTSSELDHELHHMFVRTTGQMVIPEDTRHRLSEHEYHPRTVSRKPIFAAAIAATAAVIAAGAALAVRSSQPVTAGPAIELASYRFKLPAGYDVTEAAATRCTVTLFVALPASVHPSPSSVNQAPPREAQIKTAASASGGCIALALLPSYTPTAGTPDPEAPGTARPVEVGPYQGRIFHPGMITIGPGSNDRKASAVTSLFVQLPAGNGTERDLVIAAANLRDATLVKVAASGLSS